MARTSIRLQSFARFALVMALIVIVLGAYTRLKEAGLGCPDWPLCYGYVVAPGAADAEQAQQAYPATKLEPLKAWLEMIHRYFASILGLVILGITLVALVRWRRDNSQPYKVPVLVCFLVLLQGLLGMWTVTLQLLPLIVMAHLVGGALIACLLAWLSFTERPLPQRNHQQFCRLRLWAVLAFLIVFLQISLGGWTSANYAALSCVTFPTCNGAWFPELVWDPAFSVTHPLGVNYEGGVLDMTARVTIQMVHRYGAGVTAAYLVFLILRLLRTPRHFQLRRLALIMLALLVVQLTLGVLNILLLLPIGIAVAHNLVAVLLLLSVVALLHRLFTVASGIRQ